MRIQNFFRGVSRGLGNYKICKLNKLQFSIRDQDPSDLTSSYEHAKNAYSCIKKNLPQIQIALF